MSNELIDTWHAIPFISVAIGADIYTDTRLVVAISESAIIIVHKNVWYMLHDNGGEVTIVKINDDDYFREFPTVSTFMQMNVETLMYRLLAILNNEEIDWKHKELGYLDAFELKPIKTNKRGKKAAKVA